MMAAMDGSLGTRLMVATMLLGFTCGIAILGYTTLVALVERRLSLRRDLNDLAGRAAFVGALGLFAALLVLETRLSHDPILRAVPVPVFGLVGAVLSAVILRRWAGSHRHPGLAAYLTTVLHELAARAALAGTLIAVAGCAYVLRTEPAGLAGFLLALLPLLALGGGWYLAGFGWAPGWFRRLVPVVLVVGSPRRPFTAALRAGGAEYLELTTRARGALQPAYLTLLVGSLLAVFALFLPLMLAMRAPVPVVLGQFLFALILGLQGGLLFILLLPFLMLAGFAFGFILLPLGALRGSAAAARAFGGGSGGGAGAGGPA